MAFHGMFFYRQYSLFLHNICRLKKPYNPLLQTKHQPNTPSLAEAVTATARGFVHIDNTLHDRALKRLTNPKNHKGSIHPKLYIPQFQGYTQPKQNTKREQQNTTLSFILQLEFSYFFKAASALVCTNISSENM